MSVTVGPISMRDITVYAAEAAPEDGAPVHVLGFQCSLDSLPAPADADGVWRKPVQGDGVSALIIPIPAAALSQADIIDAPHDLLDEVAAAALSASRGRVGIRVIEMPSKTERSGTAFAPASRILAAKRIGDIPSLLATMPVEKRPRIPADVVRALAADYPGWAAIVWCFIGPCRARTGPLLVRYAPLYPDVLYAPAPPPDGNEWSRREVRLAVGSTHLREGLPVRSRNGLPESASPLVAGRVIGSQLHELAAGGDFVCLAADVRAGVFAPKRVAPPGSAEATNEKTSQ